MVRRRKEAGIDVVLAAPWWVSAVVPVAGFIAFQWIVPAITADSPILKVFGPAFKPFGYFIGVIFGLIAAVNFFRHRPMHSAASSEFAREYVPSPIPPGTPATDQVTKTWEDLLARAPKPEPKPIAWSLELLRRIEWKRFEELTAAFYREIVDAGQRGQAHARVHGHLPARHLHVHQRLGLGRRRVPDRDGRQARAAEAAGDGRRRRHGPTASPTTTPRSVPPCSIAGFIITTGIAHIRASKAWHLSVASLSPETIS